MLVKWKPLPVKRYLPLVNMQPLMVTGFFGLLPVKHEQGYSWLIARKIEVQTIASANQRLLKPPLPSAKKTNKKGKRCHVGSPNEPVQEAGGGWLC